MYMMRGIMSVSRSPSVVLPMLTWLCSSTCHARLILFAVKAPALLPSLACLGPAF